MKQAKIRLGPLSLLLTVISICLTVLSILTYTTARADMRLAEKYARTVETRYALERRGQELLMAADEAAADGTLEFMDELEPGQRGTYRCTLEEDGTRLRIALRENGGAVTVEEWKLDREWDEDLTIHVWQGN